MARASSEAGDLNGAAETSSRLEIEPEIKAVAAAGDSAQVSGLESKDFDDSMEQSKNDLGLGVRSLGPEGRNAAGETENPKPPSSKPTNKGFSEAADDSAWYEALKWQDCKALMTLLEADPCLVAQTGPEGWTVLHAAAHRGCLELIDQVLELFKDKGQFVDEKSGVKVGWNDLFRAKCGKFQAELEHIIWFTCPDQVWRTLRKSNFSSGESFPPLKERFKQRMSSDAPQQLRDKLLEIMQRETSKKAFESIEEGFQSIEDYNFIHGREELQFHFACQCLREYGAKDYVKAIIDGCLELGPSESIEVLTYLFQLHNAQGQTPLHVTSAMSSDFIDLLKLVPEGVAYKECLNAKDVRGWTILHYVVATRAHSYIEALLEDDRVDVNARTDSILHTSKMKSIVESGPTALHLAILHADVDSVELLLKCPRTDVNAPLYRPILCGYDRRRPIERKKPNEYYQEIFERSHWSPLQLAATMGVSMAVRALLWSKLCDIYPDGKLPKKPTVKKKFQKVSALLLASASGNPDTLRLFLDNDMFNPLVKSEEGATALHYATDAMIPGHMDLKMVNLVGRFLTFSDLGYLNVNTPRYKEQPPDSTSYLGRRACITMLLQVGVDIWEKDNQGRFAELGPLAPREAHLWWHEKMAQETFEAKKSLNDAANAIAVVAALVATASFVGPLQPPLGYGESGAQDTHLSIRVFMVSNILSFYLAIASILFAVVPSLPMPQEGIYAEWRRTQKTVSVAIFFLLLSVLGVLISFGAATNSIVSKEYSWRRDGLSFYPTLVGGFICLLGVLLFFVRLLRFVFNRNTKIRLLYKTFVKI